MQELIEREAGMRDLVMLSARIARAGYGERVIEMACAAKAYRRKPPAHGAVVWAPTLPLRWARSARETCTGECCRRRQRAKTSMRATARAASLVLAKLVNFVLFRRAGHPASGVFLGWSIGFSLGFEDGFDSFARSIEQLIASRY